jgi:hypothetical protein
VDAEGRTVGEGGHLGVFDMRWVARWVQKFVRWEESGVLLSFVYLLILSQMQDTMTVPAVWILSGGHCTGRRLVSRVVIYL